MAAINVSYLRPILRIYIILYFGIPLSALPVTSTEAAIHFDFVSNIADEKFNLKKKTKETLGESLQVFDHLILDDSGSLVFGDGLSLPEVLPTSEDLLPGQPNAGKEDFEEISSVNKEVDHLGSIPEAEILQVSLATLLHSLFNKQFFI